MDGQAHTEQVLGWNNSGRQYVDARDTVYNLKALLEGKGKIAVYIDGNLKASQ